MELKHKMADRIIREIMLGEFNHDIINSFEHILDKLPKLLKFMKKIRASSKEKLDAQVILSDLRSIAEQIQFSWFTQRTKKPQSIWLENQKKVLEEIEHRNKRT